MADFFDQFLELLKSEDSRQEFSTGTAQFEVTQLKNDNALANWPEMPDPIMVHVPAIGDVPEKSGIAYVKTPDNEIFLLFQDGDKKIAIPHEDFTKQFFPYSDNIREAMDNHINPLNGDAFHIAQSDNVVQVDGMDERFRLVTMKNDGTVEAFGKPMLGQPGVSPSIVPLDTKIGDVVPQDDRMLADQGDWNFVMEMEDSSGKMDSLLERRSELSTGLDVKNNGVPFSNQFDVSRLKAAGFEIMREIPGRPVLADYKQEVKADSIQVAARERGRGTPEPAPVAAASASSAQAWFDDKIKGDYAQGDVGKAVPQYLKALNDLIGPEPDLSDPRLQTRIERRMEMWGDDGAASLAMSEYLQGRINGQDHMGARDAALTAAEPQKVEAVQSTNPFMGAFPQP